MKKSVMGRFDFAIDHIVNTINKKFSLARPIFVLLKMGEEVDKVIKKKKIWMANITILILFLVISSCMLYKNYSKEDKIILTAVYEYAQICGIMDVIKEKGYFEKYLPDNVEVEWVMIDSGSERRDALATERASIAIIENTRVIQAIENDYPIIILANGSTSWRGLYTVDPDIKSPNDLAEAKIAFMGTQDLILKSYLKRNFGIDLEDDQLLAVGEADLFSMLISNEVDAAVLTGTMAEKAAVLSEDVREVYDLTPEAAHIGVANWLVGSSMFFEEHPELLEPIMMAYEEAVNEINNDPREISELLSPLFDISAEQIEKEFTMFPPCVEVYGYDRTAQILYEYGYLDAPGKPFEQLTNYETIPKK